MHTYQLYEHEPPSFELYQCVPGVLLNGEGNAMEVGLSRGGTYVCVVLWVRWVQVWAGEGR